MHPHCTAQLKMLLNQMEDCLLWTQSDGWAVSGGLLGVCVCVFV